MADVWLRGDQTPRKNRNRPPDIRAVYSSESSEGGSGMAPCTSSGLGSLRALLVVDIDDDLEGLQAGICIVYDQPVEICLVLQHFHCGRYMGRTARANTRLQREIHFFSAIGLQLGGTPRPRAAAPPR